MILIFFEANLRDCGFKVLFSCNAYFHSSVIPNREPGTMVRARDEPTRTRCGPLPSWAPKITTLEEIKNIDFNFENQD